MTEIDQGPQFTSLFPEISITAMYTMVSTLQAHGIGTGDHSSIIPPRLSSTLNIVTPSSGLLLQNTRRILVWRMRLGLLPSLLFSVDQNYRVEGAD